MFKIEELAQQFKEVAEWIDFCNAQQTTIIELNKKNKLMSDEVEHLKSLLSKTTPILSIQKQDPKILTDDEEMICRLEISKLRDISIERRLTLEESKQLETYTKILNQIKNTPKVIELKAKQLTNKELLALTEGDNE